MCRFPQSVPCSKRDINGQTNEKYYLDVLFASKVACSHNYQNLLCKIGLNKGWYRILVKKRESE